MSITTGDTIMQFQTETGATAMANLPAAKTPSTAHVLANAIAFKLVWAAAILGAANLSPWLGVWAAAAVLTGHLFAVPNKHQELRLVLLTALIGFSTDSLFAATGMLQYTSGQLASWLAPVWIFGLWIGFGTTLNVAFRWLQNRWTLATILGAVSGPLSYLAGAKMGAVAFPDTTLALISLSATWSVLLPSLLALASKFGSTAESREVAHV
ncbi:MAG: DUF2878 domain-containing protein [Pseudomonadota bacterium]